MGGYVLPTKQEVLLSLFFYHKQIATRVNLYDAVYDEKPAEDCIRQVEPERIHKDDILFVCAYLRREVENKPAWFATKAVRVVDSTWTTSQAS